MNLILLDYASTTFIYISQHFRRPSCIIALKPITVTQCLNISVFGDSLVLNKYGYGAWRDESTGQKAGEKGVGAVDKVE
jgi:hypothetical protein